MSDSDNQEIKKQARRRLVGAAALALLAAILLPVAMDSEPAPSGQELDISIPDRNAPQPPLAAQDRMQPEVVQPRVEPLPLEETESVPRATTPAAASTSLQTAPRQSVPAHSAPVPVSPEPSATNSAPSLSESDRARAILEGRMDPAPVAVAAATSEFVLQVAAFNSETRAETLRAELVKQGFKAYVEKVGDISRVRVGPFKAKNEAEKVAASLRASGRNAVLSVRQ